MRKINWNQKYRVPTWMVWVPLALAALGLVMLPIVDTKHNPCPLILWVAALIILLCMPLVWEKTLEGPFTLGQFYPSDGIGECEEILRKHDIQINKWVIILYNNQKYPEEVFWAADYLCAEWDYGAIWEDKK